MNSPSADKLLHAVRRRLRLQHVRDAVRFAAWITVAAAVVAASLHLFVRPVSLGSVALSIAVAWSFALLQAAITPVRTDACAAWADRFLDGHSGYAAYLEHSATKSDRGSAAHLRLVEWIEEAARRSFESLRSTPREGGLTKPIALALVAALVSAVLLQVPTQSNAIAAAGSSLRTAGTGKAAMSAQDVTSPGAEPIANAALASGGDPGDLQRAGREGGAATPVAPNERLATREQKATADSQQAESRPRAASGGRDAGDSPDIAPDTGLSEAWQGALVSTMRSLSEPPPQATRSDATLTAEFAPATGAGQDAVAASIPAPRPAVPPEASHSVRLGPAEQAYVRAYFAGPGATP